MTKLVQLSEDAYARLKRAKKQGESFSDVIVRRFPSGDLANLGRLARKHKIKFDDAYHQRADELDRAV